MDLLRYNVRVYGILINKRKEVLLSKEHRFGHKFTKFPGGGHELGEGVIDCLKREFLEELGIEISNLSHYYTTDFFQLSAFNKKEQLISIYYQVEVQDEDRIQNGMSAIDVAEGDEHHFYWKKLSELMGEELTYPIDQLIATKIKSLA